MTKDETEENDRQARRSQIITIDRDLKKDQDRDEDGKRYLDTGPMPGSRSMPYKE